MKKKTIVATSLMLALVGGTSAFAQSRAGVIDLGSLLIPGNSQNAQLALDQLVAPSYTLVCTTFKDTVSDAHWVSMNLDGNTVGITYQQSTFNGVPFSGGGLFNFANAMPSTTLVVTGVTSSNPNNGFAGAALGFRNFDQDPVSIKDCVAIPTAKK